MTSTETIPLEAMEAQLFERGLVQRIERLADGPYAGRYFAQWRNPLARNVPTWYGRAIGSAALGDTVMEARHQVAQMALDGQVGLQ